MEGQVLEGHGRTCIGRTWKDMEVYLKDMEGHGRTWKGVEGHVLEGQRRMTEECAGADLYPSF